MPNYIPEADYDNYAGSATHNDKLTYFDYNSPTDVVTNIDAINNAIRNILMTRLGSLPGKPDFGSNVINVVFELMDNTSTTDILRNSIIQALIKWEPRILINDVVIKEIPEYNKLIANISYTYTMMGGNIDASTSILLHD